MTIGKRENSLIIKVKMVQANATMVYIDCKVVKVNKTETLAKQSNIL